MWFDKQTYLQRMHEDLEQLLIDSGWQKDLFYRITDGGTKFIDVRLFESVGSDGEQRMFGIANSYDTSNTVFEDNRSIFPNSPLGVLGVGDGSTTVFKLKSFPILISTLVVYKNGETVNPDEYTYDNTKGEIAFDTAPAVNDVLTCEFTLHPTAYEPNNEMIVFTFNKFFIYGVVTLGDAESSLGNGDGTKTAFPLGHSNIDESTLKVYKNGNPVPLVDYIYDPSTNSVVFNTAPDSADAITVEYKYFDEPNEDKTISPIVTQTSWDVDKPADIMNVVYGTERVDYLLPSPYTCVSFTPDQKFTNEWKRDSLVYYYGNANKDRIIMFMRVDPSGNPVKALFVPLYIGKLHTIGNKPRRNMVIMSGARTGDPFVWSKDKRVGGKLLDYGEKTSNGNNTVQLAQSLNGAMYQSHYLAFYTHDKMIDSGEGRYNPSLYSGKYHLSQIFIVHPNDGYVGKLDDVYAVHPKNIQQADELEITKDVQDELIGEGDGIQKVFHLEHKPVAGTLSIKVGCNVAPETDYVVDPELKTVTFNNPPTGEIFADYQFAQIFRYSLPTTDVSPMTQDVATPFNPIGLAIYKEDI